MNENLQGGEIFLEFFKNYPNLNLLTVENNYASLSTNENSTKSYSLHITVEEHKGESINKKIWFELYHSEVGVNILNLGTLGTNMRDELRPIVLGLKFEIENFEKIMKYVFCVEFRDESNGAIRIGLREWNPLQNGHFRSLDSI